MTVKTKVIGGLALLPFVVYMLVCGHYMFLGIILFAALTGTAEFYILLRKNGMQPIIWFGLPLSALFVIFGFLGLRESVQMLLSAAAPAVLVVQFALNLRKRETYRMADLAVTLFGAVYCGALLSYAFNLKHIYTTTAYHNRFPFDVVILLPCAGAWGCDAGALIAGKLLGRTPLCPAVSPNKTVEGAVGGVAASVTGTVLFSSLVGIPLIHGVLLGLLNGIFGQVGDLSESAFKREMAVKDTGKAIWGSGGVLDRIDSVLFTLPLTYYYLRLFVLP